MILHICIAGCIYLVVLLQVKNIDRIVAHFSVAMIFAASLVRSFTHEIRDGLRVRVIVVELNKHCVLEHGSQGA